MKNMEVGAADRTMLSTDNQIAVIEYGRIRDIFITDRAYAVKGEGLHFELRN
jgi:hypothetical protein